MSTKAIIIDSTLGQYTAEDISWLQKFFFQPGVLADTSGVLGLAVSQRGAGANLSVDVALGNALIDFTKNATNWKVVGLSNAITNVVVPTQSSGANRVGALIMRASIVNEPNVLKNNIITLEFVPGTSTSPLSDGAITTAISNDMFIRLADITVPTGAASIVTGNIADTRVQCKTNDAITLAPKNLKFTVQATDPASPVEGQTWYNSTSHTLNFFDGTVVKTLGTASVTEAYFTGFIVPYVGASAPTGWLLCDGSAVSRTTYASLFALAGTTFGAGDGSTTFNLPDLRSRSIIGAGTGTKVATFSSRSGNVLTVTGLSNANNNEFQTGQLVRYSTSGSVISGLTNNTDYYVIRVTNTTFSLATTLANAQNGTVITLSSDGTGTQTFTKTLTARTRGDTGGEENHAMSSTELLDHTHPIVHEYTAGGDQNNYGSTPVVSFTTASLNTGGKGGNNAMNSMTPFVTINYIVKT